MKVIIKLFFIFLLSTPAAFSQTKEVINNIKEKYIIITELLEKNQLKKSIIEGNCKDNAKNSIFLGFYYNSNALVYINYSYSQGHSNYNYHYYIWNNKVIFYFSDYASWIWDYGCAPKERGLTNEIWTYEEQRVYFNNETPVKCLFKTYEEKSIDQPYKGPYNLSDTIKNKEVDCNENWIMESIKRYLQLLSLKDDTNAVDICNLDSM